MDDLVRAFVSEAEEMLGRLRTALDRLAAGAGEEAWREAYRAVHVIRGGAGFLGLERTERLAAAGERLFGGQARPAPVRLGRELHGRLEEVLQAVREEGSEPEGDDAGLLRRLGSPDGVA